MTILVLQPDATAGIDTYIVSATPTFNHGLGGLAAGDVTNSADYRALIKFDISALPAGVVINSATLSLRCSAQQSAIDYNFYLHRSLVQWFEGSQVNAAPTAGQDGSTWNLRNANGSVAWAGGAGGASGSDWFATPTDTTLITDINTFFDWDVAVDIQDFVDGTYSNHGWWLLGEEAISNSYKTFNGSDTATPANRPTLTINYTDPAVDMIGSSTGTSTVTGTLHADVFIVGTASGTATVSGAMYTNAISGSASGTSTVTGDLQATASLFGFIAGTSTAVGRLVGDGRLAGTASGVATVTGDGRFEGQLRGTASGVATVTATGLALSLHIIRAQGCYDDPLLYITDGSVNANGQLNRLDLINPHIGFILNNWRPTIAQYKEGGTFSESPHGTGRRLTKRVFGNAIEVFDLKARGHNQNGLIEYTHELLSWQESAADFWTSEWADTPIYLVAKAARELNPRYAIIHVMSVPELENPYAQPFYARSGAAHEQLTLRLERGDWTSNPPRAYECVAISSVRSWTVTGWSTGT